MKIVECTYCGEKLERRPSEVKKHNFCCREHYWQWTRDTRNGKVTVKCEVCGKEKKIKKSRYEQNATGYFYCSKECQYKHRKGDILWNNKGGGIDCKCDQCGNMFKQDRHKYKRNKNNFCTHECRLIFNRTAFEAKGIRRFIRTCVENLNWRNSVLDRDNHTCVECGAEEYLDVHHIKELHMIMKENNIKTPQEARECSALWDVDNGLTLCVNCHAKYHPSYKGLILKRIAC